MSLFFGVGGPHPVKFRGRKSNWNFHFRKPRHSKDSPGQNRGNLKASNLPFFLFFSRFQARESSEKISLVGGFPLNYGGGGEVKLRLEISATTPPIISTWALFPYRHSDRFFFNSKKFFKKKKIHVDNYLFRVRYKQKSNLYASENVLDSDSKWFHYFYFPKP